MSYPMDPRGATKLDRIADLIASAIRRPNPVLPGIVRAVLASVTVPAGGGQITRYVSVEVGNTWVRAAWLPYNLPVLDKCCFVVRSSTRANSPWVVLATNYQVPVPPPIQVGWFTLIDNDPGPDGIQGTEDDDPDSSGDFLMVDDDGAVLIEYA